MFAAAQVERVIRHLVRFGSSRADAEDLAQEALVIAWRKQSELDRERSLDAWLFGIARNVYRNHARSERRRERVTGADEPTADAPTADARDLADVVTFRAALGALPENQQDIVILHELEEYTLKETAELLAIPFDTAKDRLRRARDVLRERMQLDLATVSASERRATSQLARAASPAVLVGVLAALSRNAAAAGTGAAVSAASFSKLALAGVLAAGIAIGVATDRLITGRPTVTSEPPVAVEHAPLDAGAVVVVEPPDAPPLDSGSVPRVTAAPPATNPEAQLVEHARVALRTGTPEAAIRTLMAHERRFPAGQLAEERDVLLVEAYLAAGKLELARKRLDDYTATYPAGLHKQRAADAGREIEQALAR